MVKKIILFILLFLGIDINCVFSYNDKVHQKINENASNIINSTLNDVLTEKLTISQGIKKKLKKGKIEQTITEWISFGGEAEDYGYWPKDSPDNSRAFNHFHDPTKEWNNAGLDNVINNLYLVNYLRYPVSAILWGLDSGRQDFIWNFSGDWSWGNAKELYYIYLAGKNFEGDLIANTEVERNAHLADSLRAVGQVMHLLQDMSVPLHTRNDVHILPLIKNQKASWTYETYTSGLVNFLNYTANFSVQNLINIPNPDPAYYDISPVSGLFDRNQYDGNSAPTNNEELGLAEYSNANFFTGDTMWNDENEYPYPSKEQTNYSESWWNINNVEQVDAEDGKIDQRIYIMKQNDDGSDTHLAVARYWLEEIATSIGSFVVIDHGLKLKYAFEMDEVCWKDNANDLIPRAVGYSAALLDYFFRGKIEISVPSGNVYSIIEGSISPQRFTFIKAKLKNKTVNETNENGDVVSYEDMGAGTLIAVAKYKVRTDYQADLSTDPPDSSSRQDNFSYSVSAPIDINSLDSANEMECTFNFSSNPIPVGITDLYLQVIFKGTLGNEIDNAIAVGMKDLSEPMQISLWNSTDMFYLDGVLKKATDIEGSATLRDRVDLDDDGILNEISIGEPYIDPYNLDTEISFFGFDAEPEYVNASYSLSPGKYGRLIFLSDPLFNIKVHRKATDPITNDAMEYSLSGVVNQESAENVFENTTVTTFRGITQHFYSAYSWYYPDSTGISTAPWPEMTDGPVSATTINP